MADYSFNILSTVRITCGRLQSNDPIIISNSPKEKNMRPGTQLWEFLGVQTWIYAAQETGFCIPENRDEVCEFMSQSGSNNLIG